MEARRSERRKEKTHKKAPQCIAPGSRVQSRSKTIKKHTIKTQTIPKNTRNQREGAEGRKKEGSRLHGEVDEKRPQSAGGLTVACVASCQLGRWIRCEKDTSVVPRLFVPLSGERERIGKESAFLCAACCLVRIGRELVALAAGAKVGGEWGEDGTEKKKKNPGLQTRRLRAGPWAGLRSAAAI